MRPISSKFRKIIDEDPFYRRCALADEKCDGRITIEHAFIYAGRQIDEMWNFVPLCEWHHSVGKWLGCGGLDKSRNEWIALNLAPPRAFKAYPKRDFETLKAHYNKKYGKPRIINNS